MNGGVCPLVILPAHLRLDPFHRGIGQTTRPKPWEPVSYANGNIIGSRPRNRDETHRAYAPGQAPGDTDIANKLAHDSRGLVPILPCASEVCEAPTIDGHDILDKSVCEGWQRLAKREGGNASGNADFLWEEAGYEEWDAEDEHDAGKSHRDYRWRGGRHGGADDKWDKEGAEGNAKHDPMRNNVNTLTFS